MMDSVHASDTVAVLVAFRTDGDTAFHDLPLHRRAELVKTARERLFKAAGIRGKPRSDLKFSRGVVVDLNARQVRRLSRQPDVWSLELNHGISYEADNLPVAPSVDALRTPSLQSRLSNGIDVAIIDSGLDRLELPHAVRPVDSACFCSRGDKGCCPNAESTQLGGNAAIDQHGHGTAVTHLLIQEFSKHTSSPLNLIPLKVIDDYAGICCPADIASAFDWVAANHPGLEVANVSLSVGQRRRDYCSSGWGRSRVVADAVSAVLANGTVVVAASGNDGDPGGIALPGCVPGVMTVGAVYAETYPPTKIPEWGCVESVQNKNQVTCFSNAAPMLDLLAPGAYFSGPWLDGSWEHETLRGTSFAAPLVAGCAGAIRAQFPDLDGNQVRESLVSSGITISDHRNQQSWPLLNCAGAMELAREMASASQAASPSMKRER
ncbi:MAG: S8 family serine peptidase [Gammaproteobacteria bacterium]|nr:S8 family serine peptidase [Gammaproteobacteria bacterium]